MKKVALILYTSGLEYDDRVRKEIKSICKYNKDCTFKIFAILPENKEEKGVTSYGIDYYVPYLKYREKYKSGKRTLLKAYDFYKTIKPKLKEFDIVWCADIETFLFPLLLTNKKLVWDLHELPEIFINKFPLRLIFKKIEKKCKIIFHANQYRIDFLKEKGLIKCESKHIPLRNYPEEQMLSNVIVEDDKFKKFSKWLGEDKCIYIQGVSSLIRRPVESVEAVLKLKDIKAVVIGGYPPNCMQTLKTKYGNYLEERIYFVGKVPQEQTSLYIKKCMLSLVFYQQCSFNNILCEPNRMFQSIVLGLPVVVGSNKPMKEIVELYNFGVAIKGDGGDVEEIVNAIEVVLCNYNRYKDSIEHNRQYILWELQDNLLNKEFLSVYNDK